MGDKLDLSALRRKAEEELQNHDSKQAAAENPAAAITKRTITLKIHYPTPGTGETLTADVQSRIMTGDERRMAHRMEVMLAGGINVAAMSIHAQNRLRALSVCSTQLREAPEWLLKYLEEDDTLLFSVFSALEEHDSRYFFRDGGTGEGAAAARRLAVIAPFDPVSASAKPG